MMQVEGKVKAKVKVEDKGRPEIGGKRLEAKVEEKGDGVSRRE